ncbi:MAG: sugar ABC transporter permease [Anaerolineae bacterium]|jgi:multiple sugar transport system permease protein
MGTLRVERNTSDEPNAWCRFTAWCDTRLEHENWLGYLLLIPTLVIVLGLVGYPFLLSIFYSFTDKTVGGAAPYVGLKNYIALAKDHIFRQTVVNTFNYTVTAVIVKIILGLAMALVLNEVTRFRRVLRAAFLLPWVVPTSLSVLAWLWMFSPQYSVITHIARQIGLVDHQIQWYAKPRLAMAAVQTVNIWRGTPYFGMIILAGLTTVPLELYEAATVDGANYLQKFRYVTLPHITPVLIVSALYSFVRTLGDFQIVWILTKGGPLNRTHLLATLAFRTAIQGKALGKGAAIAVFLFPFLIILIAMQLRYLRRE